jgi:integrase
MHGSINWQVQEIYNKSGINQIGESKNSAEQSVRNTLSEQNVVATFHKIGKKTGIFSYKTADAYRDVWRQIGAHAKAEFKIRDMQKLELKHIQSYLESKVKKGVAHSTFNLYASAVEKLESALNGYAEKNNTGNTYSFSDGIRSCRETSNQSLWRPEPRSRYANPKALIEAIKNPSYKIVAQIQFESGSRISECTHLNINNLRGLKKDPITGQEKGVFLSNRLMGGKSEEKYIFTETYKKLEEQIAKATEGRFIVKDYTYRNSLKTASKKTNQDYNGTEGLILNFKVRRNIEISKFYDNLKR